MVEAPVASGAASKSAALASGKAKRTPPMPTHAPLTPDRHEQPAALTVAEMDAIACQLSVVISLLQLITLNLDTELSEGPTKSGDVMGLLQHVDLLLHEAHEHIGKIVGCLPDDLRWRTFEARAIVAVARRMTDDDCWACSGYDTTMLVWCFDAASDSLKRALHALRLLEDKHA